MGRGVHVGRAGDRVSVPTSTFASSNACRAGGWAAGDGALPPPRNSAASESPSRRELKYRRCCWFLRGKREGGGGRVREMEGAEASPCLQQRRHSQVSSCRRPHFRGPFSRWCRVMAATHRNRVARGHYRPEKHSDFYPKGK